MRSGSDKGHKFVYKSIEHLYDDRMACEYGFCGLANKIRDQITYRVSGTVYSKLKLFLFKVRSGGDGEEDGRAVQGVRRQGEREALRRRVVRRLQGVLQEEHQEARRHVSHT